MERSAGGPDTNRGGGQNEFKAIVPRRSVYVTTPQRETFKLRGTPSKGATSICYLSKVYFQTPMSDQHYDAT